MQDISQVLLDVRDVGENILATGKDIQILLREAKPDRIRHSKDLAENILSICAYLSGLKIDDLDRWEELSGEVRKIEFSCVSLKSALKVGVDFKSKVKEVFNLLRIVEVSSNRIITLSFISKPKTSKGYNDEDVCYSNKRSCEKSCDGVCYEDVPVGTKDTIHKVENPQRTTLTFDETIAYKEACYKDKVSCEEGCRGECYLDDSLSDQDLNYRKESLSEDNKNYAELCHIDINYNQVDKRCPEYTEYFTESPFTHVESGVFEFVEPTQQLEDGSYDKSKEITRDMNEIGENLDLSAAIRESMIKADSYFEENDLLNEYENFTDLEDTNAFNHHKTPNEMEMSGIQLKSADNSVINDFIENTQVSSDDSSSRNGVIHDDPKSDSTQNVETEHSDEGVVNSCESSSNTYIYNSDDITASGYETTTEYNYYSYTPEDSTTTGYDMTTESYISGETTTPGYETTTQDLYKFSQDVYSLANDLSSKANDISSMSSDISSKVSSMGSMVSDLNTYDDDELTKTINSVTKITQEISSKTSEMSSGCSSMSSLASDISSASSDLSSSERHHPIRTTPWQKINSKGQELVTVAQSVVSATQDILARVDAVVDLAKGLRVADAVEAAAYDVTAKAQLAISETLGVATAVLELMTSLES